MSEKSKIMFEISSIARNVHIKRFSFGITVGHHSYFFRLEDWLFFVSKSSYGRIIIYIYGAIWEMSQSYGQTLHINSSFS